ncbi:UPF0223 family protein [Bacillus sp. T33-2]|uniref:UPF0223 family protein n=1 Tax=Bacillus sp. T33-2 TaxID=2054168 RepID=UPI000C795351|nr:UPF0223 family protein [Bacillus sp. T33-2]PLR97436.1 hypothetical protein CVD19_08070 [Bacillus sp. T33-2]
MEYQYPIDYTWTTDEIIDVVKFFEHVELAYDKGVGRDGLLNAYRRFKEIVPGKSDEKKIFNEFEEASGLSSYQAVKALKDSGEGSVIKIQKKRPK